MATATKSGTRRRKTVEAIVTVTKFTDSGHPFTVVRPETSLKEFVPLTGGDYLATGWDTPLRDAVAKFVSHLEDLRRPNRVVIGLMADESGSMSGNEQAVIKGINDFVEGMAKVKKVDPKTAGTVLAVITTDGRNNASQEVSAEALRTLLAAKEEDGFTFILLGAQIDAWDTGADLGFSGGLRGQTVSTVNTPAGTAAAFGNITADSSAYLADSGKYNRQMSGQTMKSVTESGVVSTSNINAPQMGGNVPPVTATPPPPFNSPFDSPYSNIEDALKKAKGKAS